MNPKHVAQKIREIIKHSPNCRTQKRNLLSNFWNSELRELNVNPKTITAIEFFALYVSGKLTDSETIHRIHRSVIAELDAEECKVHDLKKQEQEQVKSDINSLKQK